MPRLTPERRAELEAELNADQDDDDDDELEVGFGDGSYVRGRYRRVSDAAAARGFKLRPDPEPGEEEGAKGGKLKAAPEPRRFGGRRVS